MLDFWAKQVGELDHHDAILRKALILISIFFKDGLENFEVNLNVQMSSKKSGLRIDAETTANRLLEGIVLMSSQRIVSDPLPSNCKADSNVGRAIWIQ